MFTGLRKWPIAFAILLHFSQASPASIVTGEEDTVRYRISEEIFKYLNKTADPCDDFYQFACGNWPHIHPATRSNYETSVLQFAKKELDNKIAQALATDDSVDSEVFRNVKNFHRSCLKTTEVTDAYKEKLKQIINEFGKMPALEGDNWNAEEFDWLRTVAEIAYTYDIRIILVHYFLADLKNNTSNRLYIGHPVFPLKTLPMYLDAANDKYRINYRNVIAANLKQFLALNDLMANQTAKEILDFEISLVKGMKRHTVSGREMHSSTTVDKIHSTYSPELDINKLLKLSLGTLPSGAITEKNPGYQLNLISLMEDTPKHVVANYIFYNLLVPFMIAIPKSQEELGEKCLKNTKTHFAKVLDNMVYRTDNYKQMEEAIRNIFQDIKSQFQKDFAESPKYKWINATTRQLAIEKLQAMKLEINSYEAANFSHEYGKLSLQNNDYLHNLRQIFNLNALKSRLKLNQAPEAFYGGASISFGPTNVLVKNTIHIPVTTLQPYYFWSASYPQAVNFARLGFLIAHEVMHGFDEEGHTFDKLGNDYDWWDTKSKRHFTISSQCFRQQYEQLANTDALPQRVWQSENIADNGGVRLAYETYLAWHDRAMNSSLNMNLESLPNLQYTNKQLFFISFAQLWCTDIFPAVRPIKMATDAHAPANLRVVGSLANFDDFSKEFKCPQGRGMSPIKKCEWF